MSKRINVNPDHYKTAGRERQGESLIQDVNKQKYSRTRTSKKGTRIFPGQRPTGNQSRKSKRS